MSINVTEEAVVSPSSFSKPRSPHVGHHCPRCRHMTLISPCSRLGCDGWAVVCQGCEGVVDRFVASDGLCETCRAG